MLHHELHSRALVFVERAIKIGSIRVHCHHSLARNYSHYNHHSRQETSAPDHAVMRSHRFPSHCLSAEIYCKSIYQLKKLIEIVAGKHALSSLNNLRDDSLYINEVSCILMVVVSTEAPGAFYNGDLHHGWRGHPNSTVYITWGLCLPFGTLTNRPVQRLQSTFKYGDKPTDLVLYQPEVN